MIPDLSGIVEYVPFGSVAYNVCHRKTFKLRSKGQLVEIVYIRLQMFAIVEGDGPAADNRFSLSATSAGAAHLIKWAKRWRRNYLQLRSNEFVACYRAAKKGIRLPFDASKYYLPGGLGE